MVAPDVTVVMAAYGRSNVVGYAIDSVLAQSLESWELLVVDDASPDDTGEVVGGYDDPRIRYVRLSQNVGEQSGPNNVGVYLAAAPRIAFLNQDDLWFPDHLSHLLDLAATTGAEVVYSTMAMAWPPPASEDDTELRFALRGWRSRYDPRFDHPASSWLVDRSTHLRAGGWKPSGLSYGPTSQEFLFRAWRAGAQVVPSRHLTVLAEGSANRPGAYRDRLASWHRAVAARLAEDAEGFRAEINDRSEPLDKVWPAGTRRQRVTRRYERTRDAAFVRLGISPYDRSFRRQGHRRGDYLRSLRASRGLDPQPPGS